MDFDEAFELTQNDVAAAILVHAAAMQDVAEALHACGTNRAMGMGGLEAVALELKNGLADIASACGR